MTGKWDAYTARFWKMGGYIRLSREDLQKINRRLDDSNSVKNQRDILNDFHHNHVDENDSTYQHGSAEKKSIPPP